MIINQTANKPVRKLFPIPSWVPNVQHLFSYVEWAALVVILIISLITRNQPVSAAPHNPVIQFTPEMLAAIKQFLNTIQQLDLPDHQANALQVIFQNLKMIFVHL